eukprot:COSAG05_NODE_21692_length_270_cov_0.596491_1_plen_73_part_01
MVAVSLKKSLCAPKLGDLVRTESEDHVQSPREMAIREKLNRRLSVSTNNSFFKQKTAYEMESRDWSSDVCSSD